MSKEEMTVCVAGKNDIAVEVLSYLMDSVRWEYNICIVCNRNEVGKNGWQRSLRYFAQQHAIKEVKLEELYNTPNLVFLSMEFDQIVKPEKFVDARLYNIHFSLLPAYKGMYTSAIPILKGEKYTGVTLHRIDMGIDTGDIIDQVKFAVEDSDTSRDLYKKYISHGITLVLSNIEKLIENKETAIPQSSTGSTYYSKKYIDYKNIQIDLNQTATGIDRQIRAFAFREYQLPQVNGEYIISTKITNIKSCCKCGTVLIENEQAILMSTLDYNIILFKDRLDKLFAACKQGNLTEVQSICSTKEHINSRGYNGWTALMIATYNGYSDIVNYLITNGANIMDINENGTNLLMYAKEAWLNGHGNELFMLFLSLGLKIELKDYEGYNLIDYLKKDGYELQDIIDDKLNKEAEYE